MQVADGSTVVISGHPGERGTFEIIVSAMDRPHLLSDPRFADVQTRLQNLGALQDEMRAWALTLPTAQAFEDRCAQFRLAVGVMRSVREIAESDWSTARGAIARVPDRVGGEVRIPNAPWHFTHSHVGTSGEPRYRGEDNRHVLRDILHMNDEEITALEANNILSSRLPKSN
jgi:crotonobetainyl-CoA:carnitine CoA-transferase CaiB-like acyl-CoA transferase